MQPDLVITTQADFELFEHLNAACYLLYRKKSAYLITGIATILIGIYYGVIAYLKHDTFALYVITPLWIAVFLGICFYMMRTATVARRAAKRTIKFSSTPSASIQYTFFADHIDVVSQTSDTQTSYSTISRLVETSKFYLIFISKLHAHCIRKADLGVSNVEIFRTYIEDKTGKSFLQLHY